MAPCEMCGRETELLRAVVEGTELLVCDRCEKFGKVLGKARTPVAAEKKQQRQQQPEKLEVIVQDYARLVKEQREKRGLKQEELAKALAEKESLLHAIETGKAEPSIDLARKLEKFLHIRLVEEHEEALPSGRVKGIGEITLGDMVKIRKR